MSTNSLYELVNVWLPDGSWAGQFMDEATAKAWLKAKKFDLAKCEISKRGPERKPRS